MGCLLSVKKRIRKLVNRIDIERRTNAMKWLEVVANSFKRRAENFMGLFSHPSIMPNIEVGKRVKHRPISHVEWSE